MQYFEAAPKHSLGINKYKCITHTNSSSAIFTIQFPSALPSSVEPVEPDW